MQAFQLCLYVCFFQWQACFRCAQVGYLFYQEKGKSPSAAVSRGKSEPRIKIQICHSERSEESFNQKILRTSGWQKTGSPSAPCYRHYANRPRRFSPEKARKALQLPLHNPQPKAGSKRARWDKARAKSLDAATIKISVAFYKELHSNLLYR